MLKLIDQDKIQNDDDSDSEPDDFELPINGMAVSCVSFKGFVIDNSDIDDIYN